MKIRNQPCLESIISIQKLLHTFWSDWTHRVLSNKLYCQLERRLWGEIRDDYIDSMLYQRIKDEDRKSV